jgi:hypothetical protein
LLALLNCPRPSVVDVRSSLAGDIAGDGVARGCQLGAPPSPSPCTWPAPHGTSRPHQHFGCPHGMPLVLAHHLFPFPALLVHWNIHATTMNRTAMAATVASLVAACHVLCLRPFSGAYRWHRTLALARPLATPPRSEKAAAAVPPSLARRAPAYAHSGPDRCEAE